LYHPHSFIEGLFNDKIEKIDQDIAKNTNEDGTIKDEAKETVKYLNELRDSYNEQLRLNKAERSKLFNKPERQKAFEEFVVNKQKTAKKIQQEEKAAEADIEEKKGNTVKEDVLEQSEKKRAYRNRFNEALKGPVNTSVQNLQAIREEMLSDDSLTVESKKELTEMVDRKISNKINTGGAIKTPTTAEKVKGAASTQPTSEEKKKLSAEILDRAIKRLRNKQSLNEEEIADIERDLVGIYQALNQVMNKFEDPNSKVMEDFNGFKTNILEFIHQDKTSAVEKAESLKDLVNAVKDLTSELEQDIKLLQDHNEGLDRQIRYYNQLKSDPSLKSITVESIQNKIDTLKGKRKTIHKLINGIKNFLAKVKETLAGLISRVDVLQQDRKKQERRIAMISGIARGKTLSNTEIDAVYGKLNAIVERTEEYLEVGDILLDKTTTKKELLESLQNKLDNLNRNIEYLTELNDLLRKDVPPINLIEPKEKTNRTTKTQSKTESTKKTDKTPIQPTAEEVDLKQNQPVDNLKVGDTVKVNNPKGATHGKIGIIEEIKNGKALVRFRSNSFIITKSY
jgi:hypothetical protein